jgi:phytol kinase
MVYFDNFIYASIIPLIFIILNAISHKYNLVKIIERKNNKNLGTIYYPISLLVLVILTFGILNKPYVGGIGTLCMAYGDGFAAIIGTEIKSRKIYHNKTIVGTLTMLIISAFFTMIILLKYNTERIVISVIIVSIVATTLELFSKKGLDNLTVPILSSLTYLLIMYL